MSREAAERDLATLRDEISQLEAAIVAKEEQMTKIAHYIELAPKYEKSTNRGRSEDMSESARAERTRDRGAPKGGLSGMASRESVAIIRQHGSHIKTRDLLPQLSKRGIEIRGKDPVVVLSGYLSRTEELVPNRSLGWGLKEWHTTPHEEHIKNSASNEYPKAGNADEKEPNPPPPWANPN
jgi:hypothetical protein